MNTNEPLVSIITPLYNSERFIEECIESVLNQSYKNWEHIIVDDCSSDSSYYVAEKFALNDERIRLFKLSVNSGSGVARNLAINEARGEFIAFLDSDDIWITNRLQSHIEFMLKEDAVFSHASYGYLSEEGIVLNKIFEVSKNPINYQDLLKRTEISCLTAIYNAGRIGKFYMPDLRKKQDYALWLNILSSGVNSIPFNEQVAWYRQVGNSNTSDKKRLVRLHYVFLREHEGLSRIKSVYYTTYYVLNGFIRYYIKLNL